MEDNKIFQFIQALKFFDLELEEITGQPGYEDRNKVIAIRKKDKSQILCAYSTYDELLEWASQQFKDYICGNPRDVDHRPGASKLRA